MKINYIEFEKTAGPTGKALLTLAKATGRLIKRHPLAILTGLGGLGVLNIALNLGNKLRGAHQIFNETGKRQVMNYQTELLKQINENIKQKNLSQTQKQNIPITPPLR